MHDFMHSRVGMNALDLSRADSGVSSIRLNRGQRINTKGIDLIYKTSLAGGTNYTLRAWVEHLKIASLQDGEFSCYNA